MSVSDKSTETERLRDLVRFLSSADAPEDCSAPLMGFQAPQGRHEEVPRLRQWQGSRPRRLDEAREFDRSVEPDAPRASDHPQFSALTAFVEHRLSGADRDAIVNHLAECEACYFAVTEAVNAGHADGGHRRRWWQSGPIIASAAALVLTAVATWPAMQPRGLPGVARSFEPGTVEVGRSGGIPPSDAVGTLSATTQSTTDEANSKQQRPSSGALAPNALGDYHASDVRTGGTNRPASYVSPSVLTARAAAHLAQWRQTGRLDEAVAALDAARSAVGADPGSLEAQFNLASALEAVSTSFRDESRHAWEHYVTIDSDSSRSREARQRLRALGALKGTEPR